jgi:alginate O-acetyltransferase complex protein AlgI
LPIGISFYTFQLISYVADVYRGDTEAQQKYWLLLLYASLFHQCIAGPIVRYKDISRDIMTRRAKAGEMGRGITRFAVGLAKKAVLANSCAAVADSLLAAEGIASASAMSIWLGSFAYMLQIYLDFSAYSDMAIGMGLMCGLHYKENFNYPYMADSVTDFWRRWHISLSSFFRDYVYIPLGGNRCSEKRQMFNLLVVWFLTGLWHGASWNYIIWGLYYFVLLLTEKFVWTGYGSVNSALRRLMTLSAVYFGWVIFRFENLGTLSAAFKGMICLNHNHFTDAAASLAFKNNIFLLIAAVIAVTPAGKYLKNIIRNIGRDNTAVMWIYGVADAAVPAVLLLISMMALVGNSYNPFLYFQF